MVVRHLLHGVLCGWISSDDVLICVNACVRRELICAGCVQGVCSTAELAITRMVAGGRGNGLSLQSGLGELVVNDCFVRFAYRFAGKSG